MKRWVYQIVRQSDTCRTHEQAICELWPPLTTLH
jgi:hypothetical protein